MRTKGFVPLSLLVILTAPTGCDNVEWGGVEWNLRPPPPAAGADEPEAEAEEEEEQALEPISLGALLYLVERTPGGEGHLLPVAVLEEDGYSPLPDPAETPDLVERFPLERWEPGTRFVLFDQGVRAGTLTADGTARADTTFCLTRVAGRGVLELRPEAASRTRFLGLRVSDLDREPSALDPHPGVVLTDALRSASLDAARVLITRLGVPWPTSIPGIRQRVGAFSDAAGQPAVAATFVFGDELALGTPASTAYSLFLVAVEGEEGWAPALSWYQRQDSGGKAFPGALAAHDVRGTGSVDFLLEVFGQDDRWLAILGADDGDAQLLYQDPCGRDPGPDALRAYP